MPGFFTLLDGIFVLYFLYFFPIRIIGWVVGALLIWRLWKDITPPYDEIPINMGNHSGGK